MKRLLSISVFTLLITATSCDKNSEDPAEDTNHAAITTVILKFMQGGTVKYEYGFDDPDGDGGNAPTRFDQIVLPANQQYEVEVVFQNKIGGTTKDMTAAIREAGRYHEVFYTPSGVSATITKNDKDELGYPLGLSSTWKMPAAPATGTLRLQLQHLLLKKAVNSPADGHSDVNVNFTFKVE